MKLFEAKTRNRDSPMRHGERLFDFYDSSSRASIETFRQILNGWIAGFTDNEQKDLVGRLKKGSGAQFKATFVEISLHEILLRAGYDVVVHPQMPSGARVDFKASKGKSETVAYLEVTSFSPSHASESAANRQAEIYNAIDRARIPENCFLTFSVKKSGAESAKIKQLVADVETWVDDTKDKTETAQTRQFESNGWKIELTLRVLPKKRTDPRNIGIAFGGARWVSAQSEIRKALENKVGRYGSLEAPYVIAVADCKGELTGGDNGRDLIAALFGDEVVHMKLKEDGTYETWDGRKQNGFWGTADDPKNREVSAVILFPNAEIWSFGAERWQPILVRNPWAEIPLAENAIPISQINLASDKFEFKSINLAKTLGLPEPWPPKMSSLS